jgi:hypothetical protein
MAAVTRFCSAGCAGCDVLGRLWHTTGNAPRGESALYCLACTAAAPCAGQQLSAAEGHRNAPYCTVLYCTVLYCNACNTLATTIHPPPTPHPNHVQNHLFYRMQHDIILHDNDADLVVLNPDWDYLLSALRAALPPGLRVFIVVPSEDRSIRWLRVMSGVGIMDLVRVCVRVSMCYIQVLHASAHTHRGVSPLTHELLLLGQKAKKTSCLCVCLVVTLMVLFPFASSSIQPNMSTTTHLASLFPPLHSSSLSTPPLHLAHGRHHHHHHPSHNSMAALLKRAVTAPVLWLPPPRPQRQPRRYQRATDARHHCCRRPKPMFPSPRAMVICVTCQRHSYSHCQSSSFVVWVCQCRVTYQEYCAGGTGRTTWCPGEEGGRQAGWEAHALNFEKRWRETATCFEI